MQSLLERIGRWHFSAFTLDITTGGRPLPVLLLHLMDIYGLIDHFNLEPVKVWKCFSKYFCCVSEFKPQIGIFSFRVFPLVAGQSAFGHFATINKRQGLNNNNLIKLKNNSHF